MTKKNEMASSAKAPAKGPAKGHIKLTSHPSQRDAASPVVWGAPSADARGPVVGAVNDGAHRNAIGCQWRLDGHCCRLYVFQITFQNALK